MHQQQNSPHAGSKRRLLPWLGLAAVASAVVLWWPRPHPVPPPADPPIVITPVLTRPPPEKVDAGPPPAARPLAPPAPPAPPPSRATIPLQSIVLADGRHFIGIHDPVTGTVIVHAAVHGGIVTRMQAITIRVDADAILSATAYDGSKGDIAAGYVPPVVDAARAMDLATAREAAAAREKLRRQEAAERERLRLLAEQRAAAEQRLMMAKDAELTANGREHFLTSRQATLAEDRRQQRELLTGLQLQLNTAQDRWNLEFQTLGPRTTAADGTQGGAPTPATELLVGHVQLQIRQAQQRLAAIEQAQRAGNAELQELGAGRPHRKAEIQAASEALAALDP